MGVGMPPSLSPSSWSAFTECPLAFRFGYLERLPEPPSVPASRGTLVHRALEHLMVRPPADRTLAAALGDLDRASTELTGHPEFTGLELGPDEWASFRAEAAELMRRYFDLEDPTTIHPIGLELKVSATVGSVTLRGIIDRLELDTDGELVVTDYKTGSVPNEYAEQRRMAGVHIYALLCERMFGRRPARVQLLYLSKPEAIIAYPSAQSSVAVERKAAALWAAIARACQHDDFRPHPGILCSWCTFRPYCPAFGGNPVDAAELRGPGTVIEPTLPLGV